MAGIFCLRLAVSAAAALSEFFKIGSEAVATFGGIADDGYCIDVGEGWTSLKNLLPRRCWMWSLTLAGLKSDRLRWC